MVLSRLAQLDCSVPRSVFATLRLPYGPSCCGLASGSQSSGPFRKHQGMAIWAGYKDTGQYTQQLNIRCLPCVSGLMIHVSSAVVSWLLLCEGQRVPGVRKQGAWVLARQGERNTAWDPDCPEVVCCGRLPVLSRGRKHRARGTNNKVGVTSLRSPQSCRWLCCVVAMGGVRSQECSSKVVGLSSDGKSNKLCALVVSLRFGHGGVNGFVSLRPRVLQSS